MSLELKDMVVGIDIGGTIHYRKDGNVIPRPDAFRVINRLRVNVKSVYIVSRVSDDQSMRAFNWFQSVKFFEKTGLTPNKVFFCYERHEKAPICERLGVTHFIDDRPEVVAYMPNSITKLLMQPVPEDVEAYRIMNKGAVVVDSWNEVEQFFFVGPDAIEYNGECNYIK